MFFFRVSRYLKYIIRSGSRRGHGIHSPFVYDLITRVFRNKIDDNIVKCIESIRKKLKSDNSTITVNDLGSAKKVMKQNLRRVSDIAKKSPVSNKHGVLLSNMATEFGNPLIIEFGTSLGISSMYMAAGCKSSVLYTMEGCHETAGIARKNFSEADLSNIEVFTGSFDESIPVIINCDLQPGLVFIDGNHRKEPVLKYFNSMAEICSERSVIIIDDINYSKEMYEAWEAIKQDNRVTVTIDIFRMGIVFFRRGINRNNYIIRY